MAAHHIPLSTAILLLVLTQCLFADDDTDKSAPTKRPHIVFIMIDDLGWMDLACQGNKLVETPNIDRLATQGMRFTDNYAAAPVCSPTRAAIMTGKAPARLRITNHLPDQKRFIPEDAKLLPAECHDHLPLEEVTIAERLKEVGYATAFIGKWHLSQPGNTKFQPEHQGFDMNIGGYDAGGPRSFFDPYRNPMLEDRKEGEYLPDRLADESIDFVTKHVETKPDKPFYLCLWNYTVHWPMEAPEALLEKYKDRLDHGPDEEAPMGLNDTRYGAMIEAMDSAIGRILSKLDELKIADDTLVVFTSDNGAFGGVGDNRPLRQEKGYLYEGGIRVPLIVRWPGRTKAGSVCSTPTISMDFYPTLLDVAGADLLPNDTRDGLSLLPLLHGNEIEREAICFHYPNYAFHQGNRLGSAIRMGRFKLINFYDGKSELYDLKSDISESTDIIEKDPKQAETMFRELADWRRKTDAAIPRQK